MDITINEENLANKEYDKNKKLQITLMEKIYAGGENLGQSLVFANQFLGCLSSPIKSFK